MSRKRRSKRKSQTQNSGGVFKYFLLVIAGVLAVFILVWANRPVEDPYANLPAYSTSPLLPAQETPSIDKAGEDGGALETPIGAPTFTPAPIANNEVSNQFYHYEKLLRGNFENFSRIAAKESNAARLVSGRLLLQSAVLDAKTLAGLFDGLAANTSGTEWANATASVLSAGNIFAFTARLNETTQLQGEYDPIAKSMRYTIADGEKTLCYCEILQTGTGYLSACYRAGGTYAGVTYLQVSEDGLRCAAKRGLDQSDVEGVLYAKPDTEWEALTDGEAEDFSLAKNGVTIGTATFS